MSVQIFIETTYSPNLTIRALYNKRNRTKTTKHIRKLFDVTESFTHPPSLSQKDLKKKFNLLYNVG